ncbi:MAG: sensor histidine kinase [Nocardioidaceae bacterium]
MSVGIGRDATAVEPSPAAAGRRLPPSTGALARRRRWWGVAIALAGVPALTVLCLAMRSALSLASIMLAFLLLVITVALVGGLWPALVAAVVGEFAQNWFFTPPTGRLLVARPNDLIALAGFLVTAVAVATVVDRSARRAAAAARSRAETAMLASLSRSVLAGDRGLPSLLEQIRQAFGLGAVRMVERVDGATRSVGSTGPADAPADDTVSVTDALTLELSGRRLSAAERRVLVAFAEQVAVAQQQSRLAAQAAEAERLAAMNSMRAALLAAVSHDLRTPLAGIKAASSALRSPDLTLDDADRAELVETVDVSADRLVALVDNLLDMSRLQSGAVSAARTPTDVPAVVQDALHWLDATDSARVSVRWAPGLPSAVADPGFLRHVFANLVDNALRHGGSTVEVRGAPDGQEVEVRVADHGPGVPEADRERIFAPFQRLGDAPAGQGVGLGLAVARGLTEAMGGRLHAEETPGGGLTVVVRLPAAPVPAPLPAGTA